MDSRYVPRFFTVGVSPFGNPRIEAYLQLPAAYRSLSRPSSAPDAKAFTLRSCSLELLLYRSFLIYTLVLMNCLSFFELYVQVILTLFAVKKHFAFCTCKLSIPPLGEIVFPFSFGKTK